MTLVRFYTNCLRCASHFVALATPEWFRTFRWPFCVDMSPSGTPGIVVKRLYPVLRRRRWPSTLGDGLGSSHALHPPIPVEEKISGLTYGLLSLQPVDLPASPGRLACLPCRS